MLEIRQFYDAPVINDIVVVFLLGGKWGGEGGRNWGKSGLGGDQSGGNLSPSPRDPLHPCCPLASCSLLCHPVQ